MRSINLKTINEPQSFIAESYKMFCTNLSYMNVDSKNQVLLFTSSTAEEGKTTSVVNAAISFAEDDQKVLLIECDLRKARVHKLLKMPQDPGLSTVLSGKKNFDDVIQTLEEVPNLDVVTAGSLPPSPTKMLGSNAIETLIDHCRNLYDIILIDAPPVLHVTDAARLSRVADGVILIVAADETKKEALAQTKKALDKVNANILGAIMTKVKIKKGNPYYYYYNGYYNKEEGKKKKKVKNKK